jgi:protein involved in polysaccharide export with SLBB domain
VKEIYVLGAVATPGALTYRETPSTIGAIAARGGFTSKAWTRRVLVVRGSLNHPETFVVDAGDVLLAKAPDFQLQPNDIVYVSKRPWARAEELLDLAATAFVESAIVIATSENIRLIR